MQSYSQITTTNTSTLVFLQSRCPSCIPPKALMAYSEQAVKEKKLQIINPFTAIGDAHISSAH